MKHVIFGATGQTGGYLLQEALAQGHQISVLVRYPQKLPVSLPEEQIHIREERKHMKERIVSAAKKLIETKGLSAISTREIAREAGCAEGSLYHHFKNISELLLAVFLESLPSFSDALADLPFRVGENPVQETLIDVFVKALAFYRQTVPLMGALFADPNLLSKYQQALEGAKRGPHIPLNYLIAYLKAEQRLGRIRLDLNPALFAELFLGSAFQRAFREKLAGPVLTASIPSASEDEQIARDVVQFFLERIEPS